QRPPEQRLKRGLRSRSLSLPDRTLRSRPRAAQIQQRRQHILFHRIERRGRRERVLVARRSRQLITQLQHHPLGGLLSDPRNAHQFFHFAPPDIGNQIRRGQAGQHLHGQRRSDPAYRDELFKQRFLVLRKKSVQRQRILPHVRVDAQPHFGPHIGKLGERRHR